MVAPGAIWDWMQRKERAWWTWASPESVGVCERRLSVRPALDCLPPCLPFWSAISVSASGGRRRHRRRRPRLTAPAWLYRPSCASPLATHPVCPADCLAPLVSLTVGGLRNGRVDAAPARATQTQQDAQALGSPEGRRGWLALLSSATRHSITAGAAPALMHTARLSVHPARPVCYSPLEVDVAGTRPALTALRQTRPRHAPSGPRYTSKATPAASTMRIHQVYQRWHRHRYEPRRRRTMIPLSSIRKF